MPGPVSDSFDPVWGISSDGEEVKEAIRRVREKVGDFIGMPPQYILDVVRGPNDLNVQNCPFSERELRVIRFALGVALEEEDL
jgi:hypothetical protein